MELLRDKLENWFENMWDRNPFTRAFAVTLMAVVVIGAVIGVIAGISLIGAALYQLTNGWVAGIFIFIVVAFIAALFIFWDE